MRGAAYCRFLMVRSEAKASRLEPWGHDVADHRGLILRDASPWQA